MPEDRSKVLAWGIEEASTCTECGVRRDAYDEDPNAYVVDTTRCSGCERIGYAQHDWAEEGVAASGVKFRLAKPDTLPPTRMPS